MFALDVQNAVKFYKSVQALRDLSLQIPQGEFFGLLGPNGAGKSTLIKAIVGLLRLDAGAIRVFEHDVVGDYIAARRCIGYSPQEVNLDRFFSIEKILQYNAGYFGLPRAQQKIRSEELLEQFRLTSKAKVQFYKLSGGMQKRVLVAKALVAHPKFLILDEPTAGVDVEQRHELWDYLRNLNKQGTTILLTTHYIDEAEALCGRVGMIHHGEISEIGPPRDLIDKYCEPNVVAQFADAVPKQLVESLSLKAQIDGHRVTLSGSPAYVMIQRLMQKMVYEQNLVLQDIQIHKGDLEDVFLKFVGKKNHEKT